MREAHIHHDDNKSYFLDAMRHIACFHSHFPPLIDVDILVFHTWEGALDDSLFADSLGVVMEAIDGRPHEEEGRYFYLLMHFLEEKKIFWRGGL